ncbi:MULTISPECIES: DUF4271 domain-containing protein [Flavobacteriaceae]|uniref:DUF4271 domain-containing protein n=2 Tax=Flavobacteriaceae TaxID=49546 RepID=A0A4Y8ARH1_9FLAO|nr:MULTISPECIES: DUF4271 domain-containing protein [Flavobacteriaceae]TEW73795.1 DUF4271 domain-containing protein [Gramella jeungdoensis]GGK37619.1 DUF4271 domain-containing protein [Lutibacter litoralis]
MITAENIIRQDNDWITMAFLIILVVLAVQKRLFGNRLLHTSIFFFKKNKLVSYFNKEKRTFFNLYQVLSFVVELISLSLLFYFITFIFNVDVGTNGIDLFLKIAFGIGFYFLIRFLIGNIFSVIFNLEKLYKKISFEKMNYFNNLILWVLPLLVLTAYSKYFENILFKITLIVFVILVLIRYVVLIINNKKLVFNNLFYFILYLCVLEIAPLVIILKLTI